MSNREAFLAGERPSDVAFFLHEDAVGNPDALGSYAEEVPAGVVLVVDGDQGRSAFQSATGLDPMGLAREAMQTDGEVDRDLTGATCPASEGGGDGEESGDGEGGDEGDDEAGDHTTKFVFAFAEEQNEEVGGIYAEGDVLHAYAVCACGEKYSDKWVLGDEE